MTLNLFYALRTIFIWANVISVVLYIYFSFLFVKNNKAKANSKLFRFFPVSHVE